MGFNLQVIILNVVDFPAPFGPNSPKIYPESTPNDVPFKAENPLAYTFDILRTITLS